jgi:hypothetical protein
MLVSAVSVNWWGGSTAMFVRAYAVSPPAVTVSSTNAMPRPGSATPTSSETVAPAPAVTVRVRCATTSPSKSWATHAKVTERAAPPLRATPCTTSVPPCCQML